MAYHKLPSVFREEQRKKLPKDHTWINFLDYVTYCYHQADHAGQLSGRVVIDRALNRISTDFTNYFIQGYDKIEQRLMDGNFKTYIKKLYDMDSEAHDLDHDAVKGLQAHLNIVDTSEDQVDKLLEEWMDIKHDYEMLMCMGSLYISEDDRNRIINYVNLIENNR